MLSKISQTSKALLFYFSILTSTTLSTKIDLINIRNAIKLSFRPLRPSGWEHFISLRFDSSCKPLFLRFLFVYHISNFLSSRFLRILTSIILDLIFYVFSIPLSYESKEDRFGISLFIIEKLTLLSKKIFQL